MREETEGMNREETKSTYRNKSYIKRALPCGTITSGQLS